MVKEFNLSDKRNRLHDLFKSEEYKAVTRDVLKEVEKQDKEFIRLLKEELKECGFSCGLPIEKIDKLAGEKLSK